MDEIKIVNRIREVDILSNINSFETIVDDVDKALYLIVKIRSNIREFTTAHQFDFLVVSSRNTEGINNFNICL